MKDRQFHIYLDDEEYGQVLQGVLRTNAAVFT